ncbi:hypothetical protein [Nocardia testacea]|uniref:hypothetical protein n=1 Tax=Nocardia testacea TaxID=248551 RepID=UPI0033FC8E6B
MAGLVVATTAGIVKLLAPSMKARWRQGRRRRADAVAARKQRRERAARDRALAEKITAAEAAGKTVLVSRGGHGPVEETYSDGNVRYYFCNPDDYWAAITVDGYDPRTTFLRPCRSAADRWNARI